MTTKSGKRRLDGGSVMPRRIVRVAAVVLVPISAGIAASITLGESDPARTFTEAIRTSSEFDEAEPGAIAATITPGTPTATPSSSPTPTASPTESNEPQSDPPPDDDSGDDDSGDDSGPPPMDGFPGASTTGVPDGVQLAQSDSVTTSNDGQVIEDLEVNGSITVKHSDVTIRNVRVNGTDRYGISVPSGSSGDVTGLLIEDSEINGVSGERSAGIAPYGSWKASRVEVSGFTDGVKVGSNQTLEYSWIHDLYQHSGSHNDGLQSTGGHDVVIRGNRIEGLWQAQTSAMIIASNFSSVERYTIEENLLIGGGYTVYLTDKGNGNGPPLDIVVRNNVWMTGSWQFGPTRLDRHSSWIWEGNELDNGEPLD